MLTTEAKQDPSTAAMKRHPILLLSLALTSFAQASLPLNTQHQLQSALNQWRDTYHLPGASLTIIAKNSPSPPTFISGAMNLTTKQPVAPSTYFQIDSITKIYTATLVFQLIADHKLTLSQTLGQWLPQYKLWKQVTILQLLNMTGGIPSFTENKQFNATWQAHPTKTWTPQQDLSYVQDQPLQYKPGHGWHYSDSNYILLGLILEKASKTPYAKLLQAKLLSPYHYKQTRYITRNYKPSDFNYLATPYSNTLKSTANVSMSQAGAAGAIIATTRDTAMFFNDLMHNKIINKTLTKQMCTPYSTKTGQIGVSANKNMIEAYGLGPAQFYMGNIGSMWMKPGGFIGSFAQVGYLPATDTTIMIAANGWSNQAFMQLPRRFMPKLFKLLANQAAKKQHMHEIPNIPKT